MFSVQNGTFSSIRILSVCWTFLHLEKKKLPFPWGLWQLKFLDLSLSEDPAWNMLNSVPETVKNLH